MLLWIEYDDIEYLCSRGNLLMKNSTLEETRNLWNRFHYILQNMIRNKYYKWKILKFVGRKKINRVRKNNKKDTF